MDENYFKNDNLINSYYAGFIAADGCISSKRNNILIRLKDIDINILENIKNDLKIDNPIRFYKAKNTAIADLSFSSKSIKNDLKNIFNITPNKSLTLLPPNIIDENNIKSYISGYIDGDGTIGLYYCKYPKRKVLSLTVVGTYEMLFWMMKIFENKLNINFNKSLHKRKEHLHNTYIFSITDVKALNVLKYLLSVNIPRFKRKWTDELIKFIEKYTFQKRKVLKLHKDTLQVLEKFNSVTEAAYSVNTQTTNISKCCNNIKYTCKKFKWKYDE